MRLAVLRLSWGVLLLTCPLWMWILGRTHKHPGPPEPPYSNVGHELWAAEMVARLDWCHLAASVIAFAASPWAWRGSEWMAWGAIVLWLVIAKLISFGAIAAITGYWT